MRLLVLTEYFPTSETEGITGGVESRALHLLKELAKKHSVTVICSLQPKQHRLSTVADIKVIRVGPVIQYSNKGDIFKRFLFALSAMLTAFILPTDVIEAYSYLLYPAASIVGNLRSKRRVVTYHESWTPREWIKLKGWWTGAFGIACTQLGTMLGFDRYIAVSETTKLQLVKQGVSAQKIDVVHNGVDLPFFKNIKSRQYPEPSIICSSRLIKSKRVDLLVEAVALLKKEFSNVRLTINGDGEERAPIEKLIAKRKLDKNVTITGRISSFEKVNQLRKRHQIFCLPSELEGFGMVVVEAFALGLPVVCADIPVLREITDNGKGALFFHKGDAKDLAAQLRKLLTDAKLCAAKAKEATLLAERYDWKRIAREVHYG